VIAHFSYACCDRCGSPGPLGDDAKEARKLAENERWQVRPHYKYDLCSPCAYGMAFNETRGVFEKVDKKPPALASWIEKHLEDS
jgi:hypothetical protein